jgi:hypothetical protein
MGGWLCARFIDASLNGIYNMASLDMVPSAPICTQSDLSTWSMALLADTAEMSFSHLIRSLPPSVQHPADRCARLASLFVFVTHHPPIWPSDATLLSHVKMAT